MNDEEIHQNDQSISLGFSRFSPGRTSTNHPFEIQGTSIIEAGAWVLKTPKVRPPTRAFYHHIFRTVNCWWMLWNLWGYLLHLRDISKLRFMGRKNTCMPLKIACTFLWRLIFWLRCSPPKKSAQRNFLFPVDVWDKHQPYFGGSCKISEKKIWKSRNSQFSDSQ